jgi:hypothetical protein
MVIVKQYSTISSGTITAIDTGQDVHIIHDAGALSAALSIEFPSSPNDGQTFGFSSGNGITALTLISVRSIIGGVGSLVAAGYASYIYDSTSTKWFRKG